MDIYIPDAAIKAVEKHHKDMRKLVDGLVADGCKTPEDFIVGLVKQLANRKLRAKRMLKGGLV